MYCKNYYFSVNEIHGLFAKRSRIVGDCMNKSNKRQLEIIAILKRDKFVKVWQLSEYFGVANRTIQYDLSYLKKAYPGKIVSRPGKYNGGIEWVED